MKDSEPEPAFRIDGVETSLQRRGLAAGLGSASVVLLVLPVLLMATLGTSFPAPIFHALGWIPLSAPGLSLVALVVRLFRWRRPGSIVVTGDRLVLERGGHDRSFPLADLVSGYLNPLQRVVTLALSGGNLVHVHVPTAEEGQRLLVATGLDASRRTMRLRLGERFFLDFLVLSLGPLFFGAATAWAGGYAFFFTLALTFGLFRAVREMLGPAEVIIGADGVIVRQRFSSRFLPFGRIASIDSVRSHSILSGRAALMSLTGPLTLRLTDGSSVEARTRHLSDAERAQLTARIEDARSAWDAGGASPDALAQLDRNGRSAAAWRAAMRELLDAPGSYREQAVTRDALVEVLESPAAPVERRMAAALALAGAVDGDGPARIRVAAAACADERVRVALSLAADDGLDDAAMEEALAATEARFVITPRG